MVEREQDPPSGLWVKPGKLRWVTTVLFHKTGNNHRWTGLRASPIGLVTATIDIRALPVLEYLCCNKEIGSSIETQVKLRDQTGQACLRCVPWGPRTLVAVAHPKVGGQQVIPMFHSRTGGLAQAESCPVTNWTPSPQEVPIRHPLSAIRPTPLELMSPSLPPLDNARL